MTILTLALKLLSLKVILDIIHSSIIHTKCTAKVALYCVANLVLRSWIFGLTRHHTKSFHAANFIAKINISWLLFDLADIGSSLPLQ